MSNKNTVITEIDDINYEISWVEKALTELKVDEDGEIDTIEVISLLNGVKNQVGKAKDEVQNLINEFEEVEEEYRFYCKKDKPRKHAPYELVEYDDVENPPEKEVDINE